ncbi:MAG: DUF5678 domain-containing protein [Candidatus Thermoplasmatota archaeon]|jgi:hypothetical protein|nr:DUF5678 domain-containing protein [Candidatus Thermoplasmatota archaeon]
MDTKPKVDENKVVNDSQWLAGQSLIEYKGQWIAVFNKSIVAKDVSLKSVMDAVRELALSYIPLYIRVPEGAIIQ